MEKIEVGSVEQIQSEIPKVQQEAKRVPNTRYRGAVDYLLTYYPSLMNFYKEKERNDLALTYERVFKEYSFKQLCDAINICSTTSENIPTIQMILNQLKIALKAQIGANNTQPTSWSGKGVVTKKQYFTHLKVNDQKEALKIITPQYEFQVPRHLKSKYPEMSEETIQKLIELHPGDVIAQMNFEEECKSGHCRGVHIEFEYYLSNWYVKLMGCPRCRRS